MIPPGHGRGMRRGGRGTYGEMPPGCAARGGGCCACVEAAMKLCSDDMLPGVCGGVVVELLAAARV